MLILRSFRLVIPLIILSIIFSTLASAQGESTKIYLPSVWFTEFVYPVTTRVSISSEGEEANGYSGSPSINADGRYVAFSSVATNLINRDTNDEFDVFVHDRQTGETSRVSISSDGGQGNGASAGASISADGRYVSFSSRASNLVSGDTNEVIDIFIHDQQTGETSRVSVASNGTQGNAGSWGPAISADGRIVTFLSEASNLVSGDTNSSWDIFVHDRNTSETKRVSVATDGAQANGESDYHSISAGGRYVVFMSLASNLVSGDTNEKADVFVHDLQTGETSRASITSSGEQSGGWSSEPTINGDGRFVAFQSTADDLDSEDKNEMIDIFVHDRQSGETRRVSKGLSGQEANEDSWYPAISTDGRFVAFQSWASNLVSSDTNNSCGEYKSENCHDVFVVNLQTEKIYRISVSSNGVQGNERSGLPEISADGLYVETQSNASNLVTGDTNYYCSMSTNCPDIFVHDLVTMDGQ